MKRGIANLIKHSTECPSSKNSSVSWVRPMPMEFVVGEKLYEDIKKMFHEMDEEGIMPKITYSSSARWHVKKTKNERNAND